VLGWHLVYRIAALAVSTGMTLACAELIFRWHAQRTFDDKLPEWSENLVVVRGPQVFAFRPHASGVLPRGLDATRTFPYRTNALGLRDRDRAGKPAGVKRVLVLGDSFTWGYAVAEDEAYPQVAERMLAARGRPDIEVVNGAVPDYNSRMQRQLLEQLLPIYQPDAVFLAYVVNDAEPATAMPIPPEESYRYARSWFLTEMAERLNRRLFRRNLLPSAKDGHGRTYLEGFEEDSVKWRDSREAIRQMRDLSAAAGGLFTVIILPAVTQPLDANYPWRPIHDAVSKWGSELRIPTYDLLPNFLGQEQQALTVPFDGHPNADAHLQFATLLVARILEQLPTSAPAR
jgi:lysophospholipase L1-like esterase